MESGHAACDIITKSVNNGDCPAKRFSAQYVS